MNAHSRTFEAKEAIRESVPVLVGLMGPSGGGKTVSALRLATGMQQITGGDIYGIDTEARRMLHHADTFKFKHLEFNPPFGSLDYLAALRHCVGKGAKIIIVDSASHEHEGAGGMLDLHEQELDRLGGNDWQKRERVKMLAWQKPKAARRELINGLLQLNANFIFCFRAKNSVKPMKVNGRTEIVPQGFMPIAGDEFVFEMTVNALLMPGAKGVPTWQTENVGERMMIKPARQFDNLFADQKPLDESIGRALAEWARGGSHPARSAAAPTAAPPVVDQPQQQDGAAEELTAAEWDVKLGEEAKKGMKSLQDIWSKIPRALQPDLKAALDRRHKVTAADADAKAPV